MPRRSPATLALAGSFAVAALALTACGARVDSSLRQQAANQALGSNGGGTADGSTGSGSTGSSGSTSGTGSSGSTGSTGST